MHITHSLDDSRHCRLRMQSLAVANGGEYQAEECNKQAITLAGYC